MKNLIGRMHRHRKNAIFVVRNNHHSTMKDYRLVYRLCVIRGSFIPPGENTDWSFHEEEEAFQSREKARSSFLSQRDTLAQEAVAAGGRSFHRPDPKQMAE
jgi:hypothetical protein